LAKKNTIYQIPQGGKNVWVWRFFLVNRRQA